MNVGVGNNGALLDLNGTLVEAGSDIHGVFAGLRVRPAITNGTATVVNLYGIIVGDISAGTGTTTATSLNLPLPTGATTNYTIVADLPDNLTEDGAVCLNSSNAFSDETDGVCDSSSMAVKDLIREMPYGVAEVMRMRPIIFKYKTPLQQHNSTTHAGIVENWRILQKS